MRLCNRSEQDKAFKQACLAEAQRLMPQGVIQGDADTLLAAFMPFIAKGSKKLR